MYFVRLNGASLYGSFITETEVDLYLTRFGWIPKTGLPFKAWTFTDDDSKEHTVSLVKGSRETEYITKDSLPGKRIHRAEHNNLTEKFFRNHFQTI